MAQKKYTQKVVGGSLIAVAIITGVYQYQFSKVKTESKMEVLVATKDLFPGEELTKDNTTIEYRGNESIADGTIKNITDGLGSIVKEKMLNKENIVTERVISQKEYKKLDMKLVSIKGLDKNVDMFSAYEIKPYDKVDILIFDSEGTYEGKPYLEGVIVDNIKSADGISYINRADGFIPSFATFWMTSEQAQVIHQKQESGSYVKLVPTRYKSTIDEKIERKGE